MAMAATVSTSPVKATLGQEKTWQDKGVLQGMSLSSWANTTVYELRGAVWSLAGK
jgi:hypothetical protein